jgi:predicted NAD/FAD-dependent oxidoreductase
METIVVVGAGLAGLTCAYKLTQKGYKVIVLESELEAGGRTRQLKLGDQSWEVDFGAEFFTSEYKNIRQLSSQLGLVLKKLPAARYVIKHDGKEWQFGMQELVTMFLQLSIRDKLAIGGLFIKAFRLITTSSFDLATINDIQSGNLDRFILKYNLAKPLLELADIISRLTFHYDQGASQLQAGFIINWLKHVWRGQYLVPEDGIASLAIALSRKVEVKFGARVISLEPHAGKWQVVTADETFTAEGLVLATPAPIANSLLTDLNLPDELHQLVGQTQYSSLRRSYFAVSKRLLQPNEINVLNVGEGLVEFYAQPFADLLCIKLKPYAVVPASEDELAAQIASEIGVEKLQFVAHSNVRHALPIYDQAQLDNVLAYLPVRKELWHTKKVALAGDYLWGPYTESAVYSGLRAAEIICDAADKRQSPIAQQN